MKKARIITHSPDHFTIELASEVPYAADFGSGPTLLVREEWFPVPDFGGLQSTGGNGYKALPPKQFRTEEEARAYITKYFTSPRIVREYQFA